MPIFIILSQKHTPKERNGTRAYDGNERALPADTILEMPHLHGLHRHLTQSYKQPFRGHSTMTIHQKTIISKEKQRQLTETGLPSMNIYSLKCTCGVAYVDLTVRCLSRRIGEQIPDYLSKGRNSQLIDSDHSVDPNTNFDII